MDLRHTLWRCLQSTVTPILASMLEVMDRYANLDLLSDDRTGPGLIQLWLDILGDSQVLQLTPPQKQRYFALPLLCVNIITIFLLSNISQRYSRLIMSPESSSSVWFISVIKTAFCEHKAIFVSNYNIFQ